MSRKFIYLYLCSGKCHFSQCWSWLHDGHRCRNSVNLEEDILPADTCMKINKMPKFYTIFARKKYFFPIFLVGGGGKCPHLPTVCYAHDGRRI